jgi:5'-nucleotidase
MNPSHSPQSRAWSRASAFKFLGAAAVGAQLLLSGCAKEAIRPEAPPVHVQLIAFNDFHGNLEAPSGSNGRIRVPEASGITEVNAGGAAFLAQQIGKLREETPNSVVVSAGDLIGASPLISGIFHDEPTIDLMNLIGLDINGVGNHEFDEGTAELLRMQKGGCHPVDGCQTGQQFTGAKFQFLAANVIDKATQKPFMPPYAIKEFEHGVKVAFIGMTLEGTSGIVDPEGVATVTFKDEVETVNALVPELKAQGAETIVVLLHEGGQPTGLYNECPGISGPIKAIAEGFDDAVDVVISGHTHQAYNCMIDGKIVTSAASYGRLVTSIDLYIDPGTQQLVEKRARNLLVARDTASAPVDTFVKEYARKATPLANRVIGNTPVELKLPPRPLPAGKGGQASMGSVVADAMLEATRAREKGGAVIAFVNPGGVRADVNAGDITYGEVFTVQPFANNLVTLTMTGAQLEKVLEQQFSANPLVMQVSEGFSYTWKASGPDGDKVDPASIKLNGAPLDMKASYRVTVNNFMAAGGDGYLEFKEGREPLTGPIDLDVLEAYLKRHNPLPTPSTDRITQVP